MYFILAVLSFLVSILLLILYKVVEESLLPIIHSEHTVRLIKGVSRVIVQFMVDVKNDYIYRIETICEPDGDEPFEPFLDSPLYTCPPTEFLFSPPKEEIDASTAGNNDADGNNNLPRLRRSRRRINLPPPIVPPIPAQRRNLNPVVQVERIPPQQNVQADVRNFAVEHERNNRNLVRPRRVLQLLEIEALISPPPQHNPNEPRVFQFD